MHDIKSKFPIISYLDSVIFQKSESQKPHCKFYFKL